LYEKPKVDPQRTKEIQERNRERNLIVQEMKSHGSLTVEDLSKKVDLEKSKILKHLIAMRQFGKVQVVGERDNQLVYDLPKKEKQ
jgi:predicted ArsR family transcriptional regulator